MIFIIAGLLLLLLLLLLLVLVLLGVVFPDVESKEPTCPKGLPRLEKGSSEVVDDVLRARDAASRLRRKSSLALLLVDMLMVSALSVATDAYR